MVFTVIKAPLFSFSLESQKQPGELNTRIFIEHIGFELSLFVSYSITVIATYFLAGISSRYIERYFITAGRTIVDKLSNKSMK